MKNFTTSIDIQADPSTIWQVLVDFETWPQWTASVRSAKNLDPGPTAPGSRVLIEQPKLPPTIWVVTEWVPERSFVWTSRSPGVLVTASHEITQRSNDCEVTLKIHFSGFLGGLIGLLAGRLTTEYMSMEAHGLKSRAESRTDGVLRPPI